MSEEELLLKIKSSLDDTGFRRVEAETRSAEKSAGSMGAAFSNAAKVGAAAVAGLGVALAGVSVKAVLMASDLGESQSKVNVVFKDSADVINDWSKTTVSSIGMSQAQALAAAGTYGNLFTALGLGEAQAADFSKGLVNLSADLASFNNADPTEVLDALRAGLSGEAEPMKRYGVALNEVTMKQAAMRAGLGDNVQALSEAEKMQLRYNIIMEQTKTAQGDYARTSTGLANTMRTIKAEVAQLVTEFGQKLLPTVQEAASAFLTGFQEAKADGLNPLSAAVSGLSAAFDSLGMGGLANFAGRLSTVIEELQSANEWSSSWGETIATLAEELFNLNDGSLSAVKVGIDAIIAATQTITRLFVEHKGIVIAVAVAYGALKTAMAINKAVESAAASIKDAKAAWVAYRTGTQAATAATSSFGTALKLAMGPIGWIVVAVGALYVAWKTNFGGIQEKTQAVVDWLKGVPATLAAGWNVIKGNLAQFGADFKAAFVTVGEYAKSAVKVLLAIFFPLPLLFTKSGRDMVMGLWNGLKAQWDAMVNWVKGAAKRVVDSVKGVLKIQSPSRVFYDIGRWIMEGWSLGLVAGGPWVVRSAHMVMNDVLAALRDADAKVIGAEVAAAAAKAAVDAALAADGVVKGKRESASDAWGRFYDEQMDLEDALHEKKMADLEAEAEAARKAHEDARDAAIERIELQKRYIEGLLQQQRESEAKSGGGSGPGGPPALKNFDDELERVEAKMMDFLAMLGFAGDEALTDFWRAFHDGGQTGIETAEELTDVLAALADEIGKRYDELGEELDAALNNVALSEENRHKEAVRLLNERKALIDALIAAQADADADLADLIAARDKLLQQAQEAIRAAQDAAEEAEDRIHAGVMAHIDARRKAEEGAHKVRMDQLEDERGRLEVGHRNRMKALQDEHDKVTKDLEAQEKAIEKQEKELNDLKIELGVEEAVKKLVMLQDKLADIKAVIDSFTVAPRGRAAIEQRYKEMTERTKITTDAQRKAFEDVLASGTLSAEDARKVELALLGRGTMKMTDMQRILGMSAASIQQQAEAQQQIIDFNNTMISARQSLIDAARNQLEIDRTNAEERLADIDARIAAENDRHAKEMAGINAKITAEQKYFDDMMSFLDQLKDAEDERHAQRMADIAAEYALELAKLGMTQAEIDAMVSRAQAEAERIAREVEEAWKKLQEEAEKAGALKPTDPKPQPGGPANGPSLEIKDVTVGEGTIDKVELGGITVKDTVVMVKLPSGRELAAEVIDTFIGDVALLDKFSARLNERAGANGQIRGGRP